MSNSGLVVEVGMKRITEKWLVDHDACSAGVEWWSEQGTTDAGVLIRRLMDNREHLEWANWTIALLLSRKDKIRYAVFSAELVIENFEAKYPGDSRPRDAIEAAKAVIKRDSQANRKKAYSAADSAHRAADSAAYSAYSAYWAAYWAAYSAANSDWAHLAYLAAAWAARSAESWEDMMRKIVSYGLELLEAGK